MLPRDEEFLQRRNLQYEVKPENGMVCLVIKGYTVPAGYSPSTSDLLIRLPPGFPDVPPDMFWFDPPVRLSATGAFPVAADLMESYLGRTWQRFSRHLQSGVWQPAKDGLESYLSLVRLALQQSIPGSS